MKTKEEVKAGKITAQTALARLDDKYCKTAEWLRRRIKREGAK